MNPALCMTAAKTAVVPAIMTGVAFAADQNIEVPQVGQAMRLKRFGERGIGIAC